MTEERRACPFLEEITEVFCEGAPRKLIALDRLSEGSLCAGEEYRRCPMYRELQARHGGSAAGGGGEGGPPDEVP